MWFKRLVVALVALAILTPSISLSAGYSYSPAFEKLYLQFDSARGVFVDTVGRSDHVCTIMKTDYAIHGQGIPGCWKGLDVRPIKIIVPQTSVYESVAKKSSTSTMLKAKFVISNVDLAKIAYAAADAMTSPDSFVRGGLAYDARGAPADVFTDESVRCDVLGWILKKSCQVLNVETKRDRKYAYQASELINDQVFRRTGKSLVAINDEHGREATICVLKKVADTLLIS